jgi:outer membrane protein
MKIHPARTMLLLAALTLSSVLAQAADAPLSLERAVAVAAGANLEIKNADSAAAQAKALSTARASDPTAIITEILQEQQAADLALVQARSVRLLVMSDTVTEFLNLGENTDSLEYLGAQVKLSQRNLEITKARLAARTATAVDVQRAETELSSARQQLTDAQAQRPIIASRLSRTLGLDRGAEPNIGDAPVLKARMLNLTALENGLDDRVPSVVSAAQAVDFAELVVKTTDNDYTPGQTKREARSTLENAKRALFTERRKAATALRDAFRTAQDALEGANVATKNADTAARGFKNDEVRFQNELISKVQLEVSALTTQKARFDSAKAANAYLRALAGLSLSAGVDATGLVK